MQPSFAKIDTQTEAARLAALLELSILDTARAPSYDRLSRIAALSLDVPMAFVTFVDEARVWFKATYGTDLKECARAGSFCGQTVLMKAPLVVTDAAKDPRFRNNPFVAGPAGVRFYAGVAIRHPDGHALGTLCVFDTKVRDITSQELSILKELAGLAAAELALRKEATSALSASYQQFDDLAGSVPGVYFVFRMEPSGKRWFSYISPAVTAIFGLDQKDVLAEPQRWFNLVFGDDQDSLECSLSQSRDLMEPWRWQGRVISASGELRWYQIIANPRRVKDGAKDGTKNETAVWNGMILDTTDLVLAQQQLQQSQRLEAIGQLTGGVAHDFNNLLSIIQGNTELIREMPERQMELTGAILRATKNGTDLTQSLLAFARKQPLEPRAIALDQMVHSLSPLLGRTLGETIHIVTQAEDGLWPALADPGQVETAILNLTINARDAMPGGGKLTISCKNTTLDGFELLGTETTPPGDFVALSVSDEGAGMTTEVMQRAFEPFFTTKEEGSGTGLGLSMVFGFVKQSGGQLSVQSVVGRGTTITLFLPRSAAMAVRAEESEPDAAAVHGGLETILLIEDDDAVRQTTAEMLEQMGYRVFAASGSADARTFAAMGLPVHLVLSDVVLAKGETGPELVSKLKAELPPFCEVYMSGYLAGEETSERLMASGAAFIKKPFRRKDLAALIRQQLDRPQAAQ